MSKYSADLVTKITHLIGEGKHLLEDVCRMCDISTATYHRWVNEKQDFRDAVKGAERVKRENIRALAHSGIYTKLTTRTVEEVKVEMGIMPHKVEVIHPDGRREITTEYRPIKKQEIRTTKVIEPSDTIIIFAATNTDPENYRHRSEKQVTITPGRTIMDTPDDDE